MVFQSSADAVVCNRARRKPAAGELRLELGRQRNQQRSSLDDGLPALQSQCREMRRLLGRSGHVDDEDERVVRVLMGEENLEMEMGLLAI
jgi:hypothetical protein